MKLQKGVYPDFFGNYPQIIEEKTKNFVGRKAWLKLYWDRLSSLANDQDETINKALLSHHKTGKTSFLRKLYNLAFYSQHQVIPFYYEFPNQKQHGKTLCKEIQEKLICQATDFLLGEYYFSKEGRFHECLQKLQQLNTEWSINIIQRYNKFLEMAQLYPEERCDELLGYVWKFVNQIDNKPCMLILDEAQELNKIMYAVDQKGREKAIPSLYSLASVHNFQTIWLILSGSSVSDLYYKITGGLANHISRQDFYLLDKQETYDLVTILIATLGYQVYPKIYQDIWNITNGHPFYIQQIFAPNVDNYVKVKGKEKSFKSFDELLEVLYFEIANKQGELYLFWENHFVKNIHYLHEAEDQKRITLQMLFYISQQQTSLSYKKIAKKYNVQDIHLKIQSLMNADLIQVEGQYQIVDKLNDNLLSMYLIKKYSDELFGISTQHEIRFQLDKLMEKVLDKRPASLNANTDLDDKNEDEITEIANIPDNEKELSEISTRKISNTKKVKKVKKAKSKSIETKTLKSKPKSNKVNTKNKSTD